MLLSEAAVGDRTPQELFIGKFIPDSFFELCKRKHVFLVFY